MSDMSEAEVLAEFRAAGALLTGHFVLTSGLHSPFYLQCARVLMDPARAARLVAAPCAPRVAPMAPDLVVAPGSGRDRARLRARAGSSALPSIFVERVDGSFTLRRGFEIPPGSRIVVAEDVITTGLSTRECIACCRAQGGEIVGVACLVDRSGGKAELGVPLICLATPRPADLPAAQAAAGACGDPRRQAGLARAGCAT